MERAELIRNLFPDGIPELWCPLLTHFSAAALPDGERIGRHMEAIGGSVRGLLIPGSTGEGWEMTDDDILSVLGIVLDRSAKTVQRVLVGILKTELPAMLRSIQRISARLIDRTGSSSADEAFARSGVAGFTVCPPSGASLGQDEMRESLAELLRLGYPTALYQLPQVTKNEMSPDTVSSLAREFPNFILFKDTSGGDAVALSGKDFRGLFFVRGAEGAYRRHARLGGGAYDGFLLSTANSFPGELSAILSLLRKGEAERAARLSEDVAEIVTEMFSVVADFKAGNPFANANKAFDHIRAWGSRWKEHEPPLLYSGVRLPVKFLEHAARLLAAKGFSGEGYMLREEGLDLSGR